MILSKLSASAPDATLASKLQQAMAFLESTDLTTLEPGTMTLVDGEIHAIIMKYDTVSDSAVRFETHDRYIDIQSIISGVEVFGIADRETLQIDTPYDPDKDITFYRDPEHYSRVILRAGDSVTLFPEDGHKPKLSLDSPAAVHKVVIKIRL